MKNEFITALMLTLILVSMLSIGFIIKPSFAENSESNILSNDFLGKTSQTTLFDKVAKSDQAKDFDSLQNICQREPDTKQGEPLKTCSQNSSYGMDRWDFNDTSNWYNFTYKDGDKTRLIIGVNGDMSTDLTELEEIAAKHHTKIVNTVSIEGEVRAVVVELLFASVTVFARDIRILDLTSYIEPNMKVQAQFVSNDPYWNLQWGPQKIEADWAWNTTLGNSSVLAAVVDTGIDYTHPDLAANYAALGYDWVNNDADPIDDNGHGTHCSGIIAAVLNNSIGIAGIAQVRVMSEKVLDSWASGYWDWVAGGIINATDCGADIISMSLGAYYDSELVHEAVKYAYDAGVLVIAAAGNDDTDMKLYPAGYDEVVAVAATDQYDNKASFSNWGDWIELAAPGVDIYSTLPTYYVTLNDYPYYRALNYDYLGGTSMATPHVAGVAALIWSMFPNRTKDWVRLWLRCTADDLGTLGFDIYYGYGRINARNAMEQSPPAHELMAYEWRTPRYVEPGTLGIINATILNFGENDETDITMQLFANDAIVDSTLLSFLAGGNSTTVNLLWNPTVEGLYNLTLYVVPALGETSLENNILSKDLYVGFPVKAVVLQSAGNIIGDIITNWEVLNNEWNLFGDTMVYIDYTTLNKDDITYADIAVTGADVLIISCAYDPYSGWEFTDSEIEAIKQYIREGHGLIATAGTLYYYGVPNNNKLAPLFGLNEAIMWSSTNTDLLHLLNTTHPAFTNVPNPLVFPSVGTALPDDGRWDSDELVGGEYLALGNYQESAIVTYRGLVYISPWLEVIPPYYHHHLQLLYNAIRWSRYQKPEHDLTVSLQCPFHLDPGESVLVNATVGNMGLNNETNVELILLVNDEQKANLTVPTLAVGESETLSYLWVPTEGTYDVTAYAPPVLGEEDTFNNVKTACTRVSYAAVIGFIETHGETLHSDNLKLYYESLGHIVNTIYFSLTPELLADYDVLIVGEDWSDTPWSSSEIAAVQDFILSGKGFASIADELAPSVQEILSEYGMAYTGYWGYSGSSNNLDHSHPIMEGVNYIYVPNPVNSLHTTLPGYWIASDTSNMYTMITGAEVIGNVICMSDDFAAFVYDDDNEIMFANLIYWFSPREHDIAVYLHAPEFLESSETTLLNATIRNRGLNNETNVELQLRINGTLNASRLIPLLARNESKSFSFPWTPAVEGIYNITAYSPPVPAEEFTANNKVTKLVRVRSIKGYVLFDQTHETDSVIYYYSIWVAELTERGYAIETHTFGPITSAILERYDVLVIPQARDYFTSDELSAIQHFVLNGGGLLVIGDDYPSIYTDLTSFAGIAWASGGCSGYTSDITPHPVTEGVATVYFGAPISVMYVSSPAIGLIRDSCTNIMLGVSEIRGRVVGIADEDSINDYSIFQADNLRLANNLIDWLALRYEHDLAVYLDAPEFLELYNPVILNATVTNSGLNNESGVELYLLINSSIVRNATIPKLLVGEIYPIEYAWTPDTGNYNVTVYALPVPQEEHVTDNIMTKEVGVFVYTRFYRPHEWVGSGIPQGWHADDSAWTYTLPFDFPFYMIKYNKLWVSSNGLITFIEPDASCENSIHALSQKLAIAPAWENWETNDPCDIYIWQNSTHVGIRWFVRRHYAHYRDVVANFEAILCLNGEIRFNYAYNNGTVSATVGISNGVNHIIAEDVFNLNYTNTIIFTPYPPNVAVVDVTASANEVMAGEPVHINVTVENQGSYSQTFTVTTYASSLNSTKIYLDPSNYTFNAAHVSVGYKFNVTVWCEDVLEVAGAQICMEFNDTIINVTRWFVPDWDPEFFMPTPPPPAALPSPPDPGYWHVGPGHGSVKVAVMKGGMPPLAPWGHDGKIAIIEFNITALPPAEGVLFSDLIIDNLDTYLLDSNGERIPALKENGIYQLSWEGLPPQPSPGIYRIGTMTVTNLTPGSRTILTYTWNTSTVEPKFYRIWAKASAVPGEIDTTDNTYMDGIINVKKPPSANFAFSPIYPKPGENVVFNASASTPDGGTIVSYRWDFDDGNTTTTANPIIIHAYAFNGLFNVTLIITDSEGYTDSTWKTVYVFVHDVAIIDVTTSTNQTYVGRTITINVTIANEGEATETFNVTLYYNVTAGEIIGAQQVLNITPSEKITLTFKWNTTDVNLRRYNITAVANPLLGETDVLDNTLHMLIQVKMLGDINGDGKIDLNDVLGEALAFGETPDRPRWDPNIDLNGDQKIDLTDVLIVALNFGWTQS